MAGRRGLLHSTWKVFQDFTIVKSHLTIHSTLHLDSPVPSRQSEIVQFRVMNVVVVRHVWVNRVDALGVKKHNLVLFSLVI